MPVTRVAPARSPLVDPEAGDRLTNGSRTIVVHEVARGQVYFARWDNQRPDDVALVRVPRESWAELCREEAARVLP